MTKPKSYLMGLALVGTIAGLVVIGGCASKQPTHSEADGKEPIKASMGQASAKGGAQLWGENCTRCHNIRPPQYYSDAQWGVIMHHMRLRANLTGEETRQITEFLQSSN